MQLLTVRINQVKKSFIICTIVRGNERGKILKLIIDEKTKDFKENDEYIAIFEKDEISNLYRFKYFDDDESLLRIKIGDNLELIDKIEKIGSFFDSYSNYWLVLPEYKETLYNLYEKNQNQMELIKIYKDPESSYEQYKLEYFNALFEDFEENKNDYLIAYA